MTFTANRITPWEQDDISHTATAYLQSERNALMALYHTTNGDQWKNHTGWGSLQPLNEWYGVTTDIEGHVVELNLNNNQLSGELPIEIGNLIHLKTLSLSKNNLSGNMPPEIGQLTETHRIIVARALFDREITRCNPAINQIRNTCARTV